MLTPFLGWTLGTALGAITGSILPDRLADAMGIALYAMFIAIIIPPAKKSRPILGAIAISIVITCALRYIPIFGFITEGFAMIIATVLAAAIMANTALATAGDLPLMAAAFKSAIEAGRMAYLAKPGRVLTRGASASDPLTGFLRN